MLIGAAILLFIFAFFMIAHLYQGKSAKGMLSVFQPKRRSQDNSSAGQSTEILSVMGEIDRAILSNASFERVAELMFSHMHKFVPIQLVAVTQLEKTSAGQTDTIAATAAGKRLSCMVRPDKALKQVLDANVEGYLEEEPEVYPSLKVLAGLGASRILMLPIYRDAELSAIMYLGFDHDAEVSDIANRVARYFADRLGVALTSVMRAKQLYYQEHYDTVTGLPNLRSCRERLSLELSRSHRHQYHTAILFVGLDGFKKVNEASGFAGGDHILKQVAQRTRYHLRESDLVARFGNDEFVVVIPDVERTSGVSKAAEKLISLLSEYFTYDDHRYHLTCSVGIAVYPEDGQTVDTLLQNANAAMLRVKSRGGGQFMFHEEGMNAATIDLLELERDLRVAIQNDEMFVVYQPQIDLRKGKIVGVEALLRWRHPTRGIVPPMKFIGIAEESNLIHQLGAYVIKAACKQYRVWEGGGIAPARIAINVSSKELKRKSFAEDVFAVLRETGVHPAAIELEITESLLVDVAGHVNLTLQQLREQGIHIAIDDFGTGYSSLSYLANLPFDVLKIDRSFVLQISKPLVSFEIVSVIVYMAHHLGKKVCAEGVENETQIGFLRERGCEIIQGYFLSQPLTADDFEVFSRQWETSSVLHSLMND